MKVYERLVPDCPPLDKAHNQDECGKRAHSQMHLQAFCRFRGILRGLMQPRLSNPEQYPEPITDTKGFVAMHVAMRVFGLDLEANLLNVTDSFNPQGVRAESRT